MRRAGRHRRFLFLVSALAIFVASANGTMYLARVAEPMLPRERFLDELSYYPSTEWLKAMSFGESAFLADLTWLRAVQYYGEHRQLDNKFDLLHMAFDVVTNFDPRHQNAYVFGGTSLAQEGKQFARGEELLLKGRAENPDAWIYPFELGFLHYVERRDHRTAGLWFQEAARKRGCPGYVKRFAAFTAERGGYQLRAVELWKTVAEETNNPALRQKAVEQARKLAEGTMWESAIERWATGVLGDVTSNRPLTG